MSSCRATATSSPASSKISWRTRSNTAAPPGAIARSKSLSKKNGAFATFAVRDHGPGVAPEHIPRLTERFYRVDAGASRARGGTGLGLAIVKHIVLRHHGRLSIDSRVGEGSRFRVILPASESGENTGASN